MKSPLGPGDDLLMMQSPGNWPKWPVLPLKKYGATPRDAMTPGILIELMASFEYAWVPGASIFDKVKPDDPRVQRFAKDNTAKLEEILADGWVVD